MFIIPLIMIVFISGLIYFNYSNESNNQEVLENVIAFNNLQEEVYTDVETHVEYISVDIKGKVKKPGVYRINKSLDRRINDIIIMAGGLLNNADTSVTNLAKKVFDEMIIIIYSKDEVKDFVKVKEEEKEKNDECIQNNCDSCIEEDKIDNNIEDEEKEEVSNTLININTAGKEELMSLSGIGESKALDIIEYRKITPFKSIEELMNVKGIGESLYNKIKDIITV